MIINQCCLQVSRSVQVMHKIPDIFSYKGTAANDQKEASGISMKCNEKRRFKELNTHILNSREVEGNSKFKKFE